MKPVAKKVNKKTVKKKVSSKNLDKFYTHPDIAKMFVDIINKLTPLEKFDMIIEPSAGSGNILKFLPNKTLGLDLEPEGSNIIKQDFFEYNINSNPLLSNVEVACVGNPPFGSGYMNPLAKRFFNHAAEFSSLIAFIVPAKWHSSWKVHKGLNKNFGLYYSELLPKDSFVFEGNPHNVNCCMQIWSKKQLGKNLRMLKNPPTKHSDFDMFLTCDKVLRTTKVREQLIENQYWEFGLKYWGKIKVCNIEDIPKNTTTHYLFAPRKPYVRELLEQIDWTKYVFNMGAPNVGGKSILVKAYEDKKKELGIKE